MRQQRSRRVWCSGLADRADAKWAGGKEEGRKGGSALLLLPVLRRVSAIDLESSLPHSIHTTKAVRSAQDRRGYRHDALEALPDILELCDDLVLLAQDKLKVVVGLLALEVLDAAVQGIDLVLCALTNGALGLAVVRTLPCELFGGEVGDASGRGASATLLCRRLGGASIGLIGWAIVGRALSIPAHLITGPIWGDVLGVVRQESCGA